MDPQDAPAPPAGGASTRAENLLLAGLALIVTLSVVSFSGRFGTLALPPPYDDCGYIGTSFQYADILFRDGPLALIARYYSEPPLSPGVTCMGVAAVVLFGTQYTGFYVLNGIWVFLYLALASRVLRALPLGRRIPWLLVAALLPIASSAVYDFRADFPFAILLAWAIWLNIERTRGSSGARGELKPVAFLCLAVFFKPSNILLLLPVYGTVLLYRVIVAPERKPTLRALAMAHGVGVAALLVLVGKGFAFHAARLYHTLVTTRSAYIESATGTDWLFLLRGQSAVWALGKLWGVALIVVALGLATWRRTLESARQRKFVLLGLVAAIVPAYLVPTLALGSRFYLQGFPLHLLLIMGVLYAAAMIVETAPTVRSWGAAIAHSGLVAAVVALLTFRFPGASLPEREDIARYAKVQAAILDLVEERSGGAPAVLGLNFVDRRLHLGSITCELHRRGQRRITMAPISEWETTKETFEREAASCDAIAAAVVRDYDMIFLNRLSAWSHEWIERHPAFAPVATYVANDLTVTVFWNRRKPIDLLRSDSALEGFGGLKPLAGGGECRTVRLKQVVVRPHSSESRSATLAMSCRAFAPGHVRSLKVTQGGRTTTLALPDAQQFHALEVGVTLAAGRDKVTIEIETDGREASKLLEFRQLELRPAP